MGGGVCVGGISDGPPSSRFACCGILVALYMERGGVEGGADSIQWDGGESSCG